MCTASYASNPEKDVPAETFEIFIDSPPLLWFSSQKRFFWSIRKHTRLPSELMAGVEYLAQKVCVGTYATAWEIESLNKAPD